MRWLFTLLIVCLGVAPAHAQVTPEQQAQIAAYVRESNALAAAHGARPRPAPFAEERARSQRLTAAQRAEAQALFGSAFQVWQAGDYASAEIGFRRGLEIDPANGPANFYMGDILRRRGDNDGARTHFSRTRAFTPNAPEGLRAEGALSELGPATGITQAPAVFAPSSPQITFRDCAQCPEMITIPGGEMVYGDRVVTIAPLAVGRFEVTFAEWDACVAAGGCGGYRPSDEGWGRGRQPVITVSWNDAQAYAQWLSQSTGRRYRLLTMTEWEYAARAGTMTTYSWGDQNPVCDQTVRNGANFRACTDRRARPIGSFPAAMNAFGLYDLEGNVSEWVEGCPVSVCSYRAFRGGAYHSPENELRLAFWAGRDDYHLRVFMSIGFRVAGAIS